MRFVHPDLLASLEAGAVVVTPTSLLAAAIQRQYAEQQLSAGRRGWLQPGIFSLNAWLQQLWRDARFRGTRELPILLSGAQEQMLWERAIEQSGVRVLARSATARNAMMAARFVTDWHLPLAHPSWDEEEDTSQFRRWFLHVREECKENEWLLGCDLAGHIAGPAAHVAFPKRVVFAGFYERSQAFVRLTTAISDARSDVTFAEALQPSASLLGIHCADLEDELDAAARWTRARLEAQPKSSIAIFVQNLRQNRAAVERIVRGVLQPTGIFEALSSGGSGLQSPFHIHCGIPLARHPVIASALSFLEFTRPLIPSGSVTAFLCSPFFAGAHDERKGRAMVDARLRRLRETELSLRAVEGYSAECPQLNECWSRIRAALTRLPVAEAEAADWGRVWRRLLGAAGWPGSVPLSALEKEAVRQWQQVLSSFDQLGLTASAFSLQEALAHLRSLASADGPASGDMHSPVQILEPQDAASLQFDYAWLVGASELEWPPLAFAPAFIPFSLQRSENLGTATASGRREAARYLSENVRRSAKNVVVSFSSSDASDAKCSPFFSGARYLTREELHVWQGRTVLEQLERAETEVVDDTQGPALPAGVATPGGTHLLKSQSACPFQAFARWRLNAEGLEEGVFSFDARDRGDFLHRALANVWRVIETSARLRGMPAAEIESIVSDAVTQSLSSDPVDTTFRVQLRQAESDRLIAIILEWLNRESARPGEFRPRDIEENFAFTLSGLPLRVRADRIDELPDGRLVVIDYKSARVDQRHLDTGRPREPQLLVYAAMLGEAVDGLYFASVRRDEGGASGYGRIAHFGDKKEVGRLAWEKQLREWAATVTRLAEAFESGRAPVSPSKGACQYCKVKPICRIEENRSDAAEGSE
jgi:ATP-dependent helicase/nuclease subunit B